MKNLSDYLYRTTDDLFNKLLKRGYILIREYYVFGRCDTYRHALTGKLLYVVKPASVCTLDMLGTVSHETVMSARRLYLYLYQNWRPSAEADRIWACSMRQFFGIPESVRKDCPSRRDSGTS